MEASLPRRQATEEVIRFVLDLAVLVIGVLVFVFVILGWNWILNG